MKVTLNFDIENAAFEDSPDEQCRAIGEVVGSRIRDFLPNENGKIKVAQYVLRDLNGNLIGSIALEA